MAFPDTNFTTGTTITSNWLNAVNDVCVNTQDYISVKSFGAVGDGVTNDTVAVQAAFTSAAANGTPVYFPTGTYLVTEILTNRAVSYYGDGVQASTIKGLDNTKTLITFQIPYANITPFFIKDIAHEGGYYQLLTHNALPGYITNCAFNFPYEAGIRAGLNAFNWVIERCRFNGGRYNVQFRSTGTADTINLNAPIGTSHSGQLCSLISNWYVYAKQNAIYLDMAEGFNIIGGYFEIVASDDAGGNATWAGTTAKNAGDVVNINSGAASGYVYRCTVAGTTGGSVPTATSGTITDGTVTWEVLGRRAGLWVTYNKGFRMVEMQGERLTGTPWAIINGSDGSSPSVYSYSSIIANNSIRQTYPASSIEINNENRLFIANNHFIDAGPCLNIPATSTVKGLQFIGNTYQQDMSVAGTLSNPNIQHNFQQTSSDVFTPANDITGAYAEWADRKVEVQFVPVPTSTYTKTYTLDITSSAFQVGYIGSYDVQIGAYDTGSGVYQIANYKLDVTKGYNNGIAITWTKVSGNLTQSWTTTTNTATSFSGGFTLTSKQGAMIRVIRQTPLTGMAIGSSVTHTIS